MENQTTTPQPAMDYIARLVDSRKRAYAEDCLACWNQGQPFASEWPNLKAELVADVAAKMRRYLKVKSPATAKPNQEVATATHHAHGSPVPSDAMDAIEAHMTAGGELGIGGGYRFATITNAAYRSRTDSGDWYVKPEGAGYRVRQGRKSVYLFPGQLRWMNCECDAPATTIRETAKPNQETTTPSPVEAWVETVTVPESPKPDRPVATALVVLCDECSQAYRTDESASCPNPACFPGLAAYHAAWRGWYTAHNAYLKAYRDAGYGNADRLYGNAWLTRNPEPKADDFRDGKRPNYPEWETANVESKEQREARLLAEKWANPTIISRNTGVSRILASVPEQQRLKLEAEIAKASASRKSDERSSYMKGRAYIGNATPHRGMVQAGIDATLGLNNTTNWRTIGKPVFTGLFSETLGGRKFLDVVAEMNNPLYHGWQAGDPTPNAVRPFSAYTSSLAPNDMPHLCLHGIDCQSDGYHEPDAWPYAEAAG